MESKRNTPVFCNSAERKVRKAAQHPACKHHDRSQAAVRVPQGPKVHVIQYDEETFARFQALIATYSQPSANAETKKENDVP